MIVSDPNFSVGNFFNMRSDDIRNIVRSKSPEKYHTPIALVKEDNTVIAAELEGSTKISITPKIDNKTYTRVQTPSTKGNIDMSTTGTNSNGTFNGEARDVEGSSSYLLSMSAIDRALCKYNDN